MEEDHGVIQLTLIKDGSIVKIMEIRIHKVKEGVNNGTTIVLMNMVSGGVVENIMMIKKVILVIINVEIQMGQDIHGVIQPLQENVGNIVMSLNAG